MIDVDIQYIKGVGPKRAEKLNRIGISTIEDILNYFPVKYEDRRLLSKISDENNDKSMLIRVRVISKSSLKKINRKLSVFNVIAMDESNNINVTFFNQEFMYNNIKINEVYYLYGKVKNNGVGYEITNPDVELRSERVKAGKILPIYRLTYGLSNNELIKITSNCINEYYSSIRNILPSSIILEYGLTNKADAIKNMHYPENGKMYSLSKKTLAFERLLIMQMALLSMKNKLNDNVEGIAFDRFSVSRKLVDVLPFDLTKAQLRVVDEIEKDMKSSKPMNRLVQGDVGSGKTIVAFLAMINAVESGYQASLMAPTEILAMQHYQGIKEYFEKANIKYKVEFLAGSTSKKNKMDIIDRVKNGQVDILIGTHALIEKNVEFLNIGLAITDEQHRFGVRQRALLGNKGKNPDVLVMTATPIPRTLALMIYGDLDISIIDEMPPNRQEIKTKVYSKSKKKAVYDFIIQEIENGRQAYVIAPLVDESEMLELDSATETYNFLSTNYFKNYKLGLLHGKMTNKEKEDVMGRFYKGEIQILISTTVVEVGVNVPNATIMLILNAERFGLAQLHQLRGRVGRGKHQSYCFLINEGKSSLSKERLNILVSSNNGFLVAEEDLKNRGPGDFFGMRQSGVDNFYIGNLVGDVVVIKEVQELTKKLIKENPNLDGCEFQELKNKVLKLYNNKSVAFN